MGTDPIAADAPGGHIRAGPMSPGPEALAGPPPEEDVEVPGAVGTLARGAPIRPVWRNPLGGLTFSIDADGPDPRFVKWAPAGTALDLSAEAVRLRWAGRFVRVPEPLEEGADAEGSWLVTRALPGTSAVSDRWLADPARACRAIGAGLRTLHDVLPVADCPFSWSVDDRLARAGTAAAAVGPAPPVDTLVVCHGDACAPNTLVGDDGNVTGHVDLGALGVADRWADLAVATWSTVWNFGEGYEHHVLDAYGIAPDPERTDFYRRLWAAT